MIKKFQKRAGLVRSKKEIIKIVDQEMAAYAAGAEAPPPPMHVLHTVYSVHIVHKSHLL